MNLGYTVGELQEKLTESEYYLWLRYRRKFGSFSPVRKYDRGSALIATMISNANGGKASMKDFMPFGYESEDVEVSPEEFMNLLVSGGKNGSR